MRILILEHLASGAMAGEDLPADLLEQGCAMLRAAIADFAAAGHEIVTLLDPRVATPPECQAMRVDDADRVELAFDRLAEHADAALVIAPEFDGILERWLVKVEAAGLRNLGCAPAAARLCADKLELAVVLGRAGLRTPATRTPTPGLELSYPCVVKPRWGVGCENTFVCQSAQAVATLPHRDDWIVQPLVEGVALSVSLIVHDDRVRPLAAGEQHIEGTGQLAYRGGRIPVDRPDAIAAAVQAVRALPVPLHGFVGVDLVDDTVIEINPRLTMSYVGLRALCRTSMAAAILDPDAPLDWHDQQVTFDASGSITTAAPA